MIRFSCDYAEGAHPRILERLAETNMLQTEVYGEDVFSENARNLIRKSIGCESAAIHFLVGGTQTNLTVISSALRSYEGVLAAVTGHIGVHETGAIEATGHKVLVIPTEDGKISAKQVRDAFLAHAGDANHEHMVRPGMVYISQPTENGTIYSLAELEAISAVCREFGLFFFIDGARLGYGLASPRADFSLKDLARLADVFYIGGTKQGALFGEAVVIVNDALKNNFRYSIKQRGGMLAKGRLLGIQYETLFMDEDPLYMQMARSAVEKALKIRTALERKAIPLLFDSWTNQQYPIFTDDVLAALSKKYAFDFWCNLPDGHSAVRICTSWATTEENAERLISDIDAL